LGPPVVGAEESVEDQNPEGVWNPTFEVTYWRLALDIANRWRQRLGLARRQDWDQIRDKMAPLPTVIVKDRKVYNYNANCKNAYEGNSANCPSHDSHPMMIGAYGMIDGSDYGVDLTIMNNTLQTIMEVWSFNGLFGWDQPLIAMTATRLTMPELAINTLLMNTPSNLYLPNGHNFYTSTVPAYLPGNGGLLAVVAMMAGGWGKGTPINNAPGFPKQWNVQAEGFNVYP